MLGSASADDAGFGMRALGKLGRLSGITRSPEAVRKVTRRFLPLGKDVVVIGGSLVGLELAEFLAERGRNVTLLEEGQQLGLPMAMPRRWTASRRAQEHGVTVHRHAKATRITEDAVEFTEGEETRSVRADAVIYADGTTSAAPLAAELEAAGISVEVVGDAGQVGYIDGAIHSAWKATTTL
jgi:pyruvate/2-oxoglutarate dehydrogenase complex dihydrolipoamide dehydrogenase (E3) component